MPDSEEAIRTAMAAVEAAQKLVEPTTPDELAMFAGGAVRWQHILEVRERLANPQ